MTLSNAVLRSDKKSTNDFLSYLQAELQERCSRNPQYSLRAFARSLNIGSSDLSKFIRRQRIPTERTVTRLSKHLSLDPDVIESFREVSRGQTDLKKKIKKAGSTSKKQKFKQISLDSFRVIADWYNLAILELMKINGFKTDHAWIAKRLGISVNEVNIAVQRLISLEMLEITSKGKWIDRIGPTSTISKEYTNMALKRQLRQVLEKSIHALEHVHVTERDQSAVLMAINRRNLPAAKELIREFREKMCALLISGNKDDVYYLTVSLFPILQE